MNSRVIIITGASRGLGYSLAEQYSKNAKVIGLSRSGTGPSHCDSMKCDLSKSDEIQKTIDAILNKYSEVDLLINSAAVLKSAPLLLTKTEDIENMVQINVLGTVLITKAILRSMVAKKYGRIVNIISMSHHLKKPGDAVYAATKAGIEVFSQILNQEVHSQGVTINNIGLSAMPSGMLAPLIKDDPEKIKKLIPHGNYASVESVLHCIESFCSPLASDLGGQTLYLGGVSA